MSAYDAYEKMKREIGYIGDIEGTRYAQERERAAARRRRRKAVRLAIGMPVAFLALLAAYVAWLLIAR